MRSVSLSLASSLLLLAMAACGGSSDDDGDDDGDSAGADAGADDGADGSPVGGGDDDTPWEECAGEDPQPPSDNDLCLVDEDAEDPSAEPPLAVIEHELTEWEGIPAVYIRITFDPSFTDNTYGDNKVGWWGGHNFNDLKESDRCEVEALNSDGEVVFDLAIDYISEDPDAECGFASLGVTGGEGAITVGDPADVLHTETSLSRNLNERGYCEYLTDSPATDENCTVNPDAPNWDFRVVYEIWLRASAFDPAGFGSAYMTEVHSSPSKRGAGQNSVSVDPEPCADDDDCEDPDGCGGGECVDDDDCNDYEFCYNGDCLSDVE